MQINGIKAEIASRFQVIPAYIKAFETVKNGERESTKKVQVSINFEIHF